MKKLEKIFQFFTLISGFSILLIGYSADVGAEDTVTLQSASLEKKILSEKDKIQRVQKGIHTHEIRVKKSQSMEISLLTELEEIDYQIIIASQTLIRLAQNVERQQALTLEKEQEHEKAKKSKLTLQQHMENRLAAYYRLGDIGFMNVIFSAATLPELIRFKEHFHLMLRYDQQLTTAFKEKLIVLEQAREALQIEIERLGKAVAKVRTQQQKLAASRQARRELLARVNTEKKLYQRAIREMETATGELNKTIALLEQQASQARDTEHIQDIKNPPLEPLKKQKPGVIAHFTAGKGHLNPPAPGKVVTKFGKAGDKKFGLATFENGIDIQTGPEAEIRSIFKGKVVYAAFMRGYGKLIIIDHGDHYFSLLSGVGEIFKKVGDTVRQNEIIAQASNHTGLLRQGLHLEIRHGSVPEDPLNWLDPRQVTF